jgi:hypothetical protein
MGHCRKNPPPPPTEDISAVQRGRGETIVSDNSKCISAGMVWMFSGIHDPIVNMVNTLGYSEVWIYLRLTL